MLDCHVPSIDCAALVRSHIDLPRRVARPIHARCHRYMELEELVAYGNAGLAEAASRFDPSAGVLFRTFAHYRVQGEILDGIRRSAPLPRGIWQQLVALRAASSYLEQRGIASANNSPSGRPDERRSLHEIQQAIAAIRTTYLMALDDIPELAAPSTDDDLDERLDRGRIAPLVAAAVASLPLRERQLVLHHYWAEKTLTEAGAAVGVGKSGASRMHSRALRLLRARLPLVGQYETTTT